MPSLFNAPHATFSFIDTGPPHNDLFLGVLAGPQSPAYYGYSNFAACYRAFYYNITGANNLAIGQRALYHNTYGNNNSAYGVKALHDNVDGNDNIAIGYEVLYGNVHGNDNTGWVIRVYLATLMVPITQRLEIRPYGQYYWD